MKAVVRQRYGGPEVLELRELEQPVPADDEVLVRVRAASVNRADWYSLTGQPYIARPTEGLRAPKSERLGVDFAGTVEAVGKDVTTFKPGDEVFGGKDGAFAEYVCVREERAIVPKPANVTFEQAAAVGDGRPDGAAGPPRQGRDPAGSDGCSSTAPSGGVGTFAVQVAKALGAEVTAVCSTRNVERPARSAPITSSTTRAEDFTQGDRRYDLIFDVAGSRSWSQLSGSWSRTRPSCSSGARCRIAGSGRSATSSGYAWRRCVGAGSQPSSSRGSTSRISRCLRELLENGKLTPVVERQYELSEIADAFRYMGEGHARAKVVVTP